MAEAVRKLGGTIAADRVGTGLRKAVEAQARALLIADGMRIPEVDAHSWTSWRR